MICGSARITSIVRIKKSSSLPRLYAAISPTVVPRSNDQRGRQNSRDQDRLTAVQEPRPHVVTHVGRAEERGQAGLAGRLERKADSLALAVRRDVSTEQGNDAQHHDDQQTDARSPHPERDPDDSGRLSIENFALVGGDVGSGNVDGGHCILVRSRGVTSTVATSAARLTTT